MRKRKPPIRETRARYVQGHPTLTWTPRRKGHVYCSTACGRGCTFAEYTKAVTAADALAQQLGKDQWKPEVWENLGWHWKMLHQPTDTELSQLTPTKWWARVSVLGVQFQGEGETPREAICELVDALHAMNGRTEVLFGSLARHTV